MWAAGMSEKSKVTRNIFTTVWLGLNKVWGRDSPGWWAYGRILLSSHITSLRGPSTSLTTWMVPTLGTL